MVEWYFVTIKDGNALTSLMGAIPPDSNLKIKSYIINDTEREWFVYVSNDEYSFGGTGPTLCGAIDVVFDKIFSR